jgi:hypothetical protein
MKYFNNNIRKNSPKGYAINSIIQILLSELVAEILFF